jgi:hypothetical protein
MHRPNIGAVVEAALPILSEYLPGNTCLPTARVSLQVMNHFGIRAFPLSVGFKAFNAEYVRRWKAIDWRKPTPAEYKAWVDAGSWSIGVGGELTEHGWPGHLVVVARGQLLDLTIQQAQRLEKTLPLPSFIRRHVAPECIKGQDELVVEADGSLIVYLAVPEDKSFKTLPGFAVRDTTRALADLIIAEIANSRSPSR